MYVVVQCHPQHSHSLHTQCQCKLPIWGPIPPRIHVQPLHNSVARIKTKGPSNVSHRGNQPARKPYSSQLSYKTSLQLGLQWYVTTPRPAIQETYCPFLTCWCLREKEGRQAGTLLQPRFIPFYWQKKKKKKKLANGDPIYGWFLGSFMRRRTLKITRTNYKSKVALKNNTSTILLMITQIKCFVLKLKMKQNTISTSSFKVNLSKRSKWGCPNSIFF